MIHYSTTDFVTAIFDDWCALVAQYRKLHIINSVNNQLSWLSWLIHWYTRTHLDVWFLHIIIMLISHMAYFRLCLSMVMECGYQWLWNVIHGYQWLCMYATWLYACTRHGYGMLSIMHVRDIVMEYHPLPLKFRCKEDMEYNAYLLR